MAKDFWDYNERDKYEERGAFPAVTESVVDDSAGVGAYMAKVFGWMFLGLLITAAVGFGFIIGLQSSAAVQGIASNPMFFFSIIIAELVAVFAISLGLNKISAGTARMLFITYAALNGVTITYACLAYAKGTVILALVMTAVFFGIMALYGYVTKSDLTKFGPILMSALIALVVATVVNMFLKSPMMDYILCLAGLGIFAGLTAYDVKKIKTIFYGAARSQGGEVAAKLSIIGALALYLDFINMFLYLLRLLGRKN